MEGTFEIDVLGVTAAGASEMEGGEVARGAGAVEIDVLGVTVRAMLIEGGEVGAEVAGVLGVTAVKVTFLTRSKSKSVI